MLFPWVGLLFFLAGPDKQPDMKRSAWMWLNRNRDHSLVLGA